MRNTKTWTDLDLNFAKHPVSDDVAVKYNEEAIKASIRNLLLTSRYEKPFHPEIGSRLKELLFEPITPLLWGMIEREVLNILETHEPRANILNVLTRYNDDRNEISIAIRFEINGTLIVSTTNVVLERTR